MTPAQIIAWSLLTLVCLLAVELVAGGIAALRSVKR